MSTTPVANLPPPVSLPSVSMTPAANFATSFPCALDTGGKFATGVNDTGSIFAVGVNDAGGNSNSCTLFYFLAFHIWFYFDLFN